jgi:hypothetical protein
LAGTRAGRRPSHGDPFAQAKALALINAPKGNYAWHADAGRVTFTLAAQSDEHADAFGQPRGQSGINANG